MSSGPENWQAFYDTHGAAMLLYARQFTQSDADAEDALQAGFVRFWQARHRAKNSLAYLYSCIQSAARGQLRSRQRRKARELATGGNRASTEWFACPVEQQEERRLLQNILARLPAEQRGVLILKVWGELTFEQIGLLYGASPNTIASRYRYALKALRQHLARATSQRR